MPLAAGLGQRGRERVNPQDLTDGLDDLNECM